MFKLKRYLSKISRFFIILAGFLFAPLNQLLAQDYGLKNTQTAAGLPTFDVATGLGYLAGTALALAGSVFLFLIVYGGIIIMTAAGHQDSVKKGKDIIIWAVVGAVILSAAYAITAMVFNLFK